MKRRAFIAGVATAPLIPLSAIAADAKPPLAVSIAIPVHHGHRSLNEYDHFHVLVTNVSEQPIRLWTDRYSWGYDNLSFEQMHDDGTTTRIAKKPRGWDKNFPDWLELPPAESYVLNVALYSPAGQAVWANVPQPPAANANKPAVVKLRAVYEIGPDGESQKNLVWTGKVASPVGTYAIW